jgi:HSP20 family protein
MNTNNKSCCSSIEVRNEPASTQQSVATPAGSRKDVEWYRPALDLFEFPDRYEIHADLPGSTADRIRATLEGDVVTIEADVEERPVAAGTALLTEYGVGSFKRAVRLGEDVDRERLSAQYRDGVLTLVLPKRPEQQVRRIPIAVD